MWWWHFGRARATGTLRWIGTTCLFWVVSDAAAHQLGWGTALGAAITTMMVMLLQATLVWVDVVDHRERAANSTAAAEHPVSNRPDPSPTASSSGERREGDTPE